jgi:hypothetical protein
VSFADYIGVSFADYIGVSFADYIVVSFADYTGVSSADYINYILQTTLNYRLLPALKYILQIILKYLLHTTLKCHPVACWFYSRKPQKPVAKITGALTAYLAIWMDSYSVYTRQCHKINNNNNNVIWMQIRKMDSSVAIVTKLRP